MNEASEFGASLRAERERRGISLDAIAQKTKVSASVLAGIEKGDLSRWPAGIFRRAFMRSYASVVGLDVDATLAEFLRVFPEDGRVRPRASGAGQHTLRLALDERLHPFSDRRRLLGIAIDVLAVLMALGVGALTELPNGALVIGLGFSIAWHGAGSLLWGMSPGLQLMRRRLAVARATEPAPVPVLSLVAQPAEAVEVLRLASPSPTMTGPRGRVVRRRAVVRPERENRASR